MAVHTSIPLDVAAIFDPFGNAVHTALSFPVLGEDVLVTGAGPIGIMAAAVAVHAGARYTVITDVNPVPPGTGPQHGRHARRGCAPHEAGGRAEGARHDGGVRRGNGNVRQRVRLSATCWQTWPTAAKSPCSGIPSEEISIDWRTVIFNMLTIKGVYGREMYETWYKMTVMLQSGLDISPVITHRYPYSEFEKGFEAMATGCSGKVILSWE